MMGNDTIGDCTTAAAGHCIEEWTTDAGDPVIVPDSAIVAAYSAVSGYNPQTGKGDVGATVISVLNYWRQTGIGGHTIRAYAALTPGNLDHVRDSVSIFGNCYIGLQLPISAQTQSVWTVPAGGAVGQGAPGSWGGHAVPVVAYDADGLTVVTWGALKRMTWDFWSAYCDEAYALVSDDFLTSGETPAGIDLAALEQDLQEVTGGASAPASASPGPPGRSPSLRTGPGARPRTSDPSPNAPHSLIIEPDDGRDAVMSAIAGASQSIDLTIYELSDSRIVGALETAASRKVQVRVLYNWYSVSPQDQQTDVLPIVQQLTSAGVACRPAPKAFEVTHEKAMVLDGTSALVMSFNLTKQYFGSTRDFGILTLVPSEVQEVADVFEADWNGQAVSPTAPTLVWSPTNSRPRLVALIASARQTLEVYCEELGDPEILEALVAAAKRNVRVRVIAAVLLGSGPGNENAPGITLLRAGGVDAVSKSFPAPSGTGDLYMHAKVIVADSGSPSAQAFVGSENISCASLDDNRECGILVTEPGILAQIEATFGSDWAEASVPVANDPTPIQPCPADAGARAIARVASRSEN
jgi:phosphatidylserine/phosphatidylglycerophosphate/cardiolipin synthase-like enzyme